MKKRVASLILATIMIFSTASVAFAEDVTTSVYGLPQCAKGTVLGAKGCIPADVPKTNFAASAIVNVVSSGLMIGDPSGNFNPDASLTKGEAATVMLRVLGLKPVPANEGNWATPIIQQAAGLGLTASNTDPDASMSRADMAVLIAKALKIEPLDPKTSKVKAFTDVSGLDAQTQGILLALYQAGVFAGYLDGTFNPGQALSRAEMALLVERLLAKFKS
jgi:hypothetical protein